MKKSLRLLLGTIALGAMIAATAISHDPTWDGANPQPDCPPGGCAIN